MRRLAGALARVVIVTVAALSATAAARQPAFAQVKCVGLYCAIVSVPDPRHRRNVGGQVRDRRGHGGLAHRRGRAVRERRRHGDNARW
jgi:hypothetical protein